MCASINSCTPGVWCYTERCEERSARVREHRMTEQVTRSKTLRRCHSMPFDDITQKARTINFRLCLCLSAWKSPVDRISQFRIKSSALHFGLPLTFGCGPLLNTKLDALHRCICHLANARAARSVYATSKSNLFDQIACEWTRREEGRSQSLGKHSINPIRRCTRSFFTERQRFIGASSS